MKCILAPYSRRWRLATAVLTAALGFAGTGLAPAFNICNDFDGVPRPLEATSGGTSLTTISLFDAGNAGPIFGEGDSTSISDLDISLKISHPRIQDLFIWVRHTIPAEEINGEPDIVSAALFSGFGCSTENFDPNTIFNQDLAILFDDQAQASVLFACDQTIPTISGRYSPPSIGYVERITAAELISDTGLAGFNGRDIASGTWEILIRDSGSSGESAAIVETCFMWNGVSEGDISPREETATVNSGQSGNGALTISDHTDAGLHLLRYLNFDERTLEGQHLNLNIYSSIVFPLQPPVFQAVSLYNSLTQNLRRSNGVEFTRLDAAPGANGGNGRVDVADWVQIGRYAAEEGFDETVDAGGPLSGADRIVRLGNVAVPRGQIVDIPVVMRSRGVEHELGFGLQFDTQLLEFVSARRGSCVPGNAIFQLDNQAAANQTGVLGIQIGLLPDQSFLCNLTPAPPALVSATGPIANVRLISDNTRTASVSYPVATTVLGIDFSNPDAPVVTVGVDVQQNPTGDQIKDYSFGLTYDRTRLAFVGGSVINAAAFGGVGSNPTPTISGRNASILLSSQNPASTFLSGQLLTLRFTVIAGSALNANGSLTLDENGATSTSTEPPIITIGRGNRSVFNTTVVNDPQTPFFRASYNSLATSPILSSPRIELVDGTGSRLTADCAAATDPLFLHLEVSQNISPVTSLAFAAFYNPSLLELEDILVPDETGNTTFRGAVTPTNRIDQVGNRNVVDVFAADPGSTFFNGRLIRVVLNRTAATGDHHVTLQGSPAIDNRFLLSGENPVLAGPILPQEAGVREPDTSTRVNFTFDCVAGKSTDGIAEYQEELPAAEVIVSAPKAAANGPVISTRLASIRTSGGSTILDIDLNVSNNSTVVTGYEFFLTFDRFALDLATPIAVEGGAGFAVGPVVELTPTIIRGNYATHKVTATSAGSSLVNGRLARFTFVVRTPSNPLIAKAAIDTSLRGPVVPPSIFITTEAPVTTETEVAVLSFRARPGVGAIPTTLAFGVSPQTIIAPSVRNVAGVPIYSHFANGSITIIDNSDARPVVRLRDAVLQANTGEQIVDVVLDSVGIENAVGFTLNFNSTDIEIESVARGRDVPASGYFYTLPNENDTVGLAGANSLKILTSLQPGRVFPAGERVVASLRVRTRDSISTFDTSLNFTELYPNPALLEETGLAPSDLVRSPRRGQVVDPNAIALVADFPDGTITVAGTNCVYTLNPTTQSIPAVGGEFAVDVNVPSGCPWTAVSDVAWITITENASGNGTNTIRYEVGPNDSCSPRTAQIQVAGKPLNITQQPCVINLSPAAVVFAGTGGEGTIQVVTDSICSWTVVSNVTWITFTSPSSGQGPASISFTVAQNVGQPRTATIDLLSCATGTVTQVTIQQIICEYALSPVGPSNFAAAGGQDSFSVITTAGCPWQAVPSVPWIQVLNPSGDSVDNLVEFNVLPNEEIATAENSSGTPPLRRGVITVAGRTYEVFQAFASCNFDIIPATTTVDGGAQLVSLRLAATDEACSWELTESSPWIVIQGATADVLTGIGSRDFTVAVDANPSPTESRSAIVTVRRGGANIDTATIIQLGGDNNFAFTFAANPESDINGDGFLTSTDAWSPFSPGAPNFTTPTFSQSPTFTADGPGRISIASTNNNNTFGWWESPALVTNPATATGNTYKAVYQVSSLSASSANVPVFRLRASSTDFQQSDVMIITSNGAGALSPSSGASHEYCHLFSIPPQAFFSAQAFKIYFEILNFGGEDPSGQTIALERIVISPFDPATDLADERTEVTYIMSQPSSASAFQPIVPSAFTAPVFGASSRGLTATSNFTGTSNPPTTIGFLTANTGVPIVAGRIYSAEVTVSASAQTALSVRKSLVPTFRARLNTGDFTASSYVNIESIDENSRVPTFTDKNLYTAWLAPTATQPSGAKANATGNVLISFDYLLTPESFNSTEEYRNAADIILIIESVRLKSFILAP